MEALAIQRSLVVLADREHVWRALTTPASFSKWFEADISFADLTPGTPLIFDFGNLRDEGRIAAVEAPERFAFYWSAAQDRPEKNLVTFRLEPVADGTRITVTEEGFEALPEALRHSRYDENSEGWEIQLRNIANFMRVGSHP